jgi:hypothetical protein
MQPLTRGALLLAVATCLACGVMRAEGTRRSEPRDCFAADQALANAHAPP